MWCTCDKDFSHFIQRSSWVLRVLLRVPAVAALGFEHMTFWSDLSDQCASGFYQNWNTEVILLWQKNSMEDHETIGEPSQMIRLTEKGQNSHSCLIQGFHQEETFGLIYSPQSINFTCSACERPSNSGRTKAHAITRKSIAQVIPIYGSDTKQNLSWSLRVSPLTNSLKSELRPKATNNAVPFSHVTGFTRRKTAI